MFDWTSGYVAELGYTYGFYRELTPQILQFSGLTKGVCTSKSSRERLAFCELGCGQGFSTNLLAAANPEIDFYATDFNPAQIAGARQLADQAGTENVHFFDDSFAQFEARTDLPQFDIIALHGIYSWIAAEHRDTIVRFIDKRLKPGGLVYISYNCLPGWAGPSPVRQLMLLAGGAAPGHMLQKIDAGLAFIDRMKAANARYFATVPGITERIERIKAQNRNYLAHEYMNADWTLFYHSDVARELSHARLSYLGSAHLLDHVDAVNLTADQQAILNETADPVLRETYRDYMINQQFRRDIFARGSVALSAGEAQAIWLETRFALSSPRSEITMKVNGALGEANLQEEVYAPIVEAFARPVEAGRFAAISLRQVLADNPNLGELGWGRIQQAILVLVGAGHLQPCPHGNADDDAAWAESATRFNRVVLEKARYSADLGYLATPTTGGGITVDRFQQLFLLAQLSNEADPAAFAWRMLDAQGQRLLKDGSMLQTAEENISELRQRHAAFEARLPIFRALGIV